MKPNAGLCVKHFSANPYNAKHFGTNPTMRRENISVANACSVVAQRNVPSAELQI